MTATPYAFSPSEYVHFCRLRNQEAVLSLAIALEKFESNEFVALLDADGNEISATDMLEVLAQSGVVHVLMYNAMPYYHSQRMIAAFRDSHDPCVKNAATVAICLKPTLQCLRMERCSRESLAPTMTSDQLDFLDQTIDFLELIIRKRNYFNSIHALTTISICQSLIERKIVLPYAAAELDVAWKSPLDILRRFEIASIQGEPVATCHWRWRIRLTSQI